MRPFVTPRWKLLPASAFPVAPSTSGVKGRAIHSIKRSGGSTREVREVCAPQSGVSGG